MATHLDLEEQEQIDQLKDFWKQYGNLITFALVLALTAFAGWNGWQWWQRDRALKAGALYEELDRAAGQGDVAKVGRVFADMKDRYGSTTYGEQAALLAAKVQWDKGKGDDARATLQWLADQAPEAGYRAIARLRLAGLLLDQKRYDDALKVLAEVQDPFKALAADRRGDVYQQQGKHAEAISSYQEAWKTIDPKVDYRRLIQIKLEALGAPPASAPAGGGVAGGPGSEAS